MFRRLIGEDGIAVVLSGWFEVTETFSGSEAREIGLPSDLCFPSISQREE